MRTQFPKDVCLADIESRVINSMRGLDTIRNDLAETLAMIPQLQRNGMPRRKQDNRFDQKGKDPRRAVVLDLLAGGTHPKVIAKQFNTSERSIRRVRDRAKAEGDMRFADKPQESVPADSSQSASRSLGKDASDPVAGTAGEATVAPSCTAGGSEEESTGSRTVEVQAGNEPGSMDASSESVSAGREAETGGEGDASPPEPDTFQSLGDIAKRIVDRRWKEQQADVAEACAAPPDNAPVLVGVDLSSGPDETIHALYVRGEGFKPVETKPLAEAKVRRHIPGPVGIEVDLEANVVRGEAGEQRVDKLFARVLQHMRDGGLYSVDVLAKTAGYSKADLVKDSLRAWKPKLEQIGVDVFALTKGFDLVQLRRLEA